jgi:hypothetical protein
MLTAKSLKTTVVIEPEQLLNFLVPVGVKSIPFAIVVGGRNVTGQFNAKSLRRAIAAAQTGPVKIIVQGVLQEGDVLADAGVSAQPYVPKETPSALLHYQQIG